MSVLSSVMTSPPMSTHQETEYLHMDDRHSSNSHEAKKSLESASVIIQVRNRILLFLKNILHDEKNDI